MINYLPLYLRRSKVFQSLIREEEKLIRGIDIELEDFFNQLFIGTATWGLVFYEKELDIQTDLNKSIEARRAALTAKWQAGSKIDRYILESVATAILNTVVTVSFDGRIIFTFSPNKDDRVQNISEFYRIVDDIKPAHLPFLLQAKIKSEITISSKSRSWKFPYPICGIAKCAPILGKNNQAYLTINPNSINVNLPYPITNRKEMDKRLGKETKNSSQIVVKNVSMSLPMQICGRTKVGV